MNMSSKEIEELLSVDIAGWKAEAADIASYYAKFGAHFSPALSQELVDLQNRLNAAK